MRIFISGGCKNGKSSYAQYLAKRQKQSGPLYYVATMSAVDYEDEKRIENHQIDREGLGFITVEQPKEIEHILKKCDLKGSFLLDSLTALLGNEMFSSSGSFDGNAYDRIASGLADILSRIENIVIVSDFIYSDAIIYDPLTELYRKSLAYLDRVAAEQCDIVLETAYMQIIVHKGMEVFNALY